MLAIVLRRLGVTLLILPGIVTLLFLIFGLLGDPARMLAGQRADAATLTAIRSELGLNQSRWQQYLHYLNDLSPLGTLSQQQLATNNYSYIKLFSLTKGKIVALKLPYLNRSYVSHRPVAAVYAAHLPPTLLLAVVSLLLAALLGIGLGLVAAYWHGHWPDRLCSAVAVLGISTPSFYLAVLLMWLLAVQGYPLTGLNLSGYVRTPLLLGDGYHYEWHNLILPALTLGLRPLALLFQLTRGGLIEAMQQDYFRTARAKGLSIKAALVRHALPNAAGPVFTSLSGWFASLLTGAFFVETIFDWPGVGKLTIDALFTNDYPMLMGCCLSTALLFLLVSTLTDMLYPLLDPRVRA